MRLAVAPLPLSNSCGSFFSFSLSSETFPYAVVVNDVRTERLQRRLAADSAVGVVFGVFASGETRGIPKSLVARAVRHENVMERNDVLVDLGDDTP